VYAAAHQERVMRIELTAFLLAGLLLLASCSGNQPDGEHYYSGKRIEIIIPTSVGGGTDRFARVMAEGLNRYVPGNPRVISRQMTGGGGILAANWIVEQAPQDGTVLFAGTGQGTLRQMLGQRALRAKPSDFVDLIALPAVRTVTIAAGKGITQREDVRNLKHGPPLHTALVDPIGGISFVLQAGMLDMPLRIIPGYHGGRDRDLAMFRGEIDIIQQIVVTFASSTQPLLDRGAVLLWTDGLALADGTIGRDPGLPDIPTFDEVYELAFGEPPSGDLWEIYRHVIPLIGNGAKLLQLPVGAPPEAREALRQGIEAMVADPAFAARIRAESEGHDPLWGDELEALLSEARNIPPAKLEFLRQYIGERFQMDF
jgi:hypothetical protein